MTIKSRRATATAKTKMQAIGTCRWLVNYVYRWRLHIEALLLNSTMQFNRLYLGPRIPQSAHKFDQ